jgi:hypothetical protein
MPPLKRKPTTYNRILKEFTKINNKLPEDRKLSIKDRRKIIREELLPKFKGLPKSKIRVTAIKNSILAAYDKIPPKEICDLNYIDISEYAYVEWYALDETISELVPDCIYVKVTAGDFGETKIINTRNYEYSRNGVRRIVENIRPEANNSSGKYIFSGYQKLRPRKKNDGTPENYYLDFVLFEIDKKGQQLPLGDTDSVKFELPKGREIQKKKTKVKQIIEGRIKKLKQKRDSKKRAKKTLDKNIKQFTEIVKAISKSKSKPKVVARAKELARKQLLKSSKLLEQYYKEGKLTKVQYDKALEKLFKEFEK